MVEVLSDDAELVVEVDDIVDVDNVVVVDDDDDDDDDDGDVDDDEDDNEEDVDDPVVDDTFGNLDAQIESQSRRTESEKVSCP